MEEAPENGKKSSRSAYAKGMNENVFDIFGTSNSSSSGRLVHAVLWYFFHASVYVFWSMSRCV
jgi:hypothetical protein